jgi:transcriptional regulator with XRE-family HTH domain
VDRHGRQPHFAKGRLMAKSIVDQLQRAIRASGQTEYAIAKGSGVSQSIVNRFVSGQRGISLETAAKLAAYLKLDLR